MAFLLLKRKVEKPSATGKVSVELLHKLECAACPLRTCDARSQDMPPSGVDAPDLYILGEAPGKHEDAQDEPFVGDSGQFLRRALPRGYRDWTRFSNVVRTRPPNNRTPVPVEIEACRPSVIRDIEKTKPFGILAVGGTPLKWLTEPKAQITAWRGQRIPVKVGSHICWAFPVLHPSGIFRAGKKREDVEQFNQDVTRACKWLNELPPASECYVEQATLHDGCFYCEKCDDRDLKVIEAFIDRVIADGATVGVDYETAADEANKRNLRPYAKAARILSIAISTFEETIAFGVDHCQAQWSKDNRKKLDGIIKRFLMAPNVTKIAHNLPFELEWSMYFYGWRVNRAGKWKDTMAAAFTIDENGERLALDDLCLSYLGLPLKSKSEVDRKKLDTYRLIEVLRYNALDAKYTKFLHPILVDELKREKLFHIYQEFVRRIQSCVKTQIGGLPVDFPLVLQWNRKLTGQLKDASDDLRALSVVKKLEGTGEEFNPGSQPQAITILRDYLKRKEVEVEKDKYQADEKILKTIDHPFASKLLTWRDLNKQHSTYIKSIVPLDMAPDEDRESYGSFIWGDDLIHTMLNVLRTDTGRLSSDSPNMQNWPKRKNREIRAVIRVADDYWIVSIDYGQIEARTIAMASRDKFLVQALWEKYDIHQEWAERIARRIPRLVGGKDGIADKAVMKKFRDKIKNKWVFPAFFQARLEALALYLEADVEEVRPEFQLFWKTFSGVRDYQERVKKFYYKNGYVELLNGQRRHVRTTHLLVNTVAQGSAAAIVMDAYNRLSEMSDARADWYLQPALQIHDDLTFIIPKKKLDHYLDLIEPEMLRPTFDWINVPLSVEVSKGQNWFEQHEVAKLFSNEYFKE